MALPEKLRNTLALPVVAAPMFLVSGPELVVACCGAGVMGSFPALNQRSSEGYEQWLEDIKAGLAALKAQGKNPAPFAVNLIVHGTNTRLMADVELTVKHQVPVVITSLGINKDVIDAVHSYGGLVFHDVTTTRFAEKALDAGVDGVIAVCAGAGGHGGAYNPFAFVSELRAMTDKTILAAGGISNGAAVLGALSCGADLVYMGTRFIVASEARAQPEYKQMVIDTSAKDIVYTPKISGVPANFLAPSLAAAGLDLKTMATPDMNIREELGNGAKVWVDLWSAGQGVGGIHTVESAEQICDRLREEYLQAAADLQARQKLFAGLK